jgi:hypothetical protein
MRFVNHGAAFARTASSHRKSSDRIYACFALYFGHLANGYAYQIHRDGKVSGCKTGTIDIIASRREADPTGRIFIILWVQELIYSSNRRILTWEVAIQTLGRGLTSAATGFGWRSKLRSGRQECISPWIFPGLYSLTMAPNARAVV